MNQCRQCGNQFDAGSDTWKQDCIDCYREGRKSTVYSESAHVAIVAERKAQPAEPGIRNDDLAQETIINLRAELAAVRQAQVERLKPVLWNEAEFLESLK